jgi:hypothetical protein
MGRIINRPPSIPSRKPKHWRVRKGKVPLHPQPPTRLAANGVWRRRARRRRPRLAAAPGGGTSCGVPWRRLPCSLRGLLRRRPLPPRPLRCQPGITKHLIRDAISQSLFRFYRRPAPRPTRYAFYVSCRGSSRCRATPAPGREAMRASSAGAARPSSGPRCTILCSSTRASALPVKGRGWAIFCISSCSLSHL